MAPRRATAALARVALASPIGRLTVHATARGVCAIDVGRRGSGSVAGNVRARPATAGEARRAFRHASRAAHELREYFAGGRRRFTVPLDLAGTDFQRRAWAAMRRVPYGATMSYAQQARRAGAPRAVRAVGSANGANPVPVIVPCHRIVASDGSLGGYALGLAVKRRLLALESRRP
jgi:methylated-DNA-[protein]-cysteine S-methyltransferase